MKIAKKKYIVIGLILLILCIFSTGIAFFANEFIKNSIDDIFKWISGLSSLITLTIALLLFDKYGLNKKVKNRKQDVVLELLDELCNFSLNIEVSEKKGSTTSFGYSLTSGDYMQIDKMKGKELLFRKSYPSEIGKLDKYKKNYWMPKSIQKKLGAACFYNLLFDDKLDPFDEKYIRINFSLENLNTYNDKSIKYGLMKIPNINENYFKRWEELYISVIEWLNANADFELNRD